MKDKIFLHDVAFELKKSYIYFGNFNGCYMGKIYI